MSLFVFLRVYLSDIQLFQTVKDVNALAHDPLVDLLESIESLLKHLNIYTKIPHTAAMTEIVVKTLLELFSILALATKLIKQGQPGEFLLAEDLLGLNATQRNL
jgi:hypothetical protein